MDKASQHYSDMEIMEFVNLYDKKDQVIGSTAILSDDKESGYITVVLVNDVLTVTEFSSDSKLVLPKGKLYYFGLLEFCFKDSMGNFINVDTKMRITPPSGDHIQKELYDMQNVELMTNSTSVYLPNSMTFISQQPYTNACVAASSAMILQYWKEHKGYSAISQSGTSLFNILKSSTYIGTGSAGLSDFYYGTKSYSKRI